MAITSSFVAKWENTLLNFAAATAEANRLKLQSNFNSDAAVFLVDPLKDKITLKVSGVYHLEFNAHFVFQHDKVIQKRPQFELRLFNGTQQIGLFFRELMEFETDLGGTQSVFRQSVYFVRDMHFSAGTELEFRVGISSNPAPADFTKISFNMAPGGVLAGHLW
jgi:hypothetical protein